MLTLIGATTENPFFEVNAPLISRSTVFRLHPLSDDDLATLVDGRWRSRAGDRRRRAATWSTWPAATPGPRSPRSRWRSPWRRPTAAIEVPLDDVERARQIRVLRYGEDDHYDVISAFIKSIRGSDPDAGLYWLARMLEAGEDARYIARRLVILASEDVGMADSMGLVVADAAARAVEFVGLPEAGLNLAHAVIYLATAPKSNTTMAGLARAFDDVRHRQAGAVPGPLRSVHPYQRNKLQEGGGYRYPHNDPSGFVPQEYRPPTSPARSARRSAGCTTGPRPTATRPRSPTACGRGGATPPTTARPGTSSRSSATPSADRVGHPGTRPVSSKSPPVGPPKARCSGEAWRPTGPGRGPRGTIRGVGLPAPTAHPVLLVLRHRHPGLRDLMGGRGRPRPNLPRRPGPPPSGPQHRPLPAGSVAGARRGLCRSEEGPGNRHAPVRLGRVLTRSLPISGWLACSMPGPPTWPACAATSSTNSTGSTSPNSPTPSVSNRV